MGSSTTIFYFVIIKSYFINILFIYFIILMGYVTNHELCDGYSTLEHWNSHERYNIVFSRECQFILL